MWHVRAEIAPAILLVVDFGGWYKVDSKSSSKNSSRVIQHTQVSLLKDVIVPYTHLLPTLLLSENKDRRTLLYFKGAKHRHRVSAFYHSIQHLDCLLSFISNPYSNKFHITLPKQFTSHEKYHNQYIWVFCCYGKYKLTPYLCLPAFKYLNLSY
jgi:hypothetical protein